VLIQFSLHVQKYQREKAAFNKKTLFTSKLDLNLRKKLVKCYIWSMVLYDLYVCHPRDKSMVHTT